MKVLGISAYYHDASAALLVDGRIIAAAQEERFSRRKHDPRFPSEAVAYCLREGGLRADDLDAIAYYEKPFRKFDRILVETLTTAPRGLRRYLDALPLWLSSRLWVRADIERRLDTRTAVYFLQHHESHAASAFGPSPFAEAAVLTIDGVGEWTTNGLWHAAGTTLRPLVEIRYPDSIGLLYSAFTAYCGFRVNDGEYKLMGLAPYGEPVFEQVIRQEVIDLRDDGSYALNPEMFAFRHRGRMTSELFHRTFGGPPRRRDEPLLRKHADLARSIQAVTEDMLLRQARHARERTGLASLCLAGGVALNCVANGRLAREGIFDRVWIQPASGDAGGAIGAAYALWFRRAKRAREAGGGDLQAGSLLGPAYSDGDMEAALKWGGFEAERLDDAALAGALARALAQGDVVGWYQGRMEFGPRALGNRSILADARDPQMQSRVNRAVKFREGFRPFAPIVRDDAASEWFDMPASSPYMLLTGTVRNATPSPLPGHGESIGSQGVQTASPIPAVTHVDTSARVQTVASGSNPKLELLLDAFARQTGCPVLLNTSFNVKDEPIVCSPYDAVACFARTGINRLAMGPYLTQRKEGARDVPPRPAALDDSKATRSVGKDVLGAVAGAVFLHYALHSSRAALAALSLGAALAALGVAAPAARQRLGHKLRDGGRLVARAVALPVLVALYYVLLTPAGWLFRILSPRGSLPSDSYWQSPEAPDHDPERPY